MTNCSSITPSIIRDCSDPAYRAAHPDECKGYTELLLIPDHSLKEPGQTVDYKVILRANGVEMEITKGLTFASSNVGAAVVGPDGIATAVSAGATTISVSWQDLFAYAQIDVVGSCADTKQYFAVLIDNSASMSQSFSSSYATKLSFSKSVAADFCDSINFSKDSVSAWKFSDSALQVYDGSNFGVNAIAARSRINSISSTANKTNLADALRSVIDSFPSDGVRVIVLFSDGEWDTATDDPKPVARAFRESGGFICVVATRAWGDGFVDLAEMASGGFLLSAYGNSEDTVLENLAGLKSFICSGSCLPPPGTAPTAQLNFTGLTKWEIVQDGDFERRLDLVGLGLWDVLPGNGLYLDGAGTADYKGEPFSPMKIRTLDAFSVEAGKDYELSLMIAGNNVNESGTFQCRIKVTDDSTDEVDETVSISNKHQPFTEYPFTFTPASTHDVKIVIEQLDHDGREPNVGLLFDVIRLTNTTDDDEIFLDNFDSENPRTIEPSGSNYGGCVSIEAQSSDPTPPVKLAE